MKTLKERLKAMFMSKEQILYLINIFISCIIYGGFSATLAYQQIGLGTRFYSLNLILGCLIGCIYAFVSADNKKKRWVFCHYKAIDIIETVFCTTVDMVFLLIYFLGDFNPYVDETRVLKLFFGYNMFWRIIWAVVQSIIPGIGNVYEQSLYKNQIDYQNHSNAEMLMDCFGAAFGALLSFIVGDYIRWHPYLIFLLVWLDWYGLWSRWQFYFNKKNYAIIKRNFAKDSGEWRRKQKEGNN